jgi:transcriptional regulator with XRE-family HTH domain
MRSSFGRLAQDVRVQKGITQSAFAASIGESLSRVSQLEHQRTSINDAVIGKYIEALDLDGEAICKLRRFADFSNSRLAAKNKNLQHDSIHALLKQFGDKLSASTVEGIRNLIIKDLDPDLALEVASLEFSSNQSVRKQGTGRKPRRLPTRPTLALERFVELCLLAEEHRARFTDPNTRRMNIEYLLASESSRTEKFDFDVLEALPPYAQGAFACIVGTSNGHVILLEEEGYELAVRGSGFRRHVICHEFAHHVLHARLLDSKAETYLPIQEWAKKRDDGENTSSMICQFVDTPEEVDAECFATMLLVPWTEFLKGTEPKYLAKDFGEQQGEVERYARFFKNPAVINRFRQILWERGEKNHPIFLTA